MDRIRLNEIYDGFKNYVFPNKETEYLAIKRMNICIDCDKYTKTKRCSMCGCFMPAKTRSVKSKCPNNKW